MYELRHVPTNNVVEFFGTAVLAERYLNELALSHGESALNEYVLTFQGEEATEDFEIEGAILLDTIQQLAIEERRARRQANE
jgi:hypothetical protein